MAGLEFKAPQLFPVIHNETVTGTLESVEMVLEKGADGVFLINHQNNAATLIKRYRAVRSRFPEAFVGLNFLDMHNPLDAMVYLELSGLIPSAVWTDWYPLVPEQMSEITEHTPKDVSHKTLLFAGVSHKAADHTNDPFLSAEMAEIAAPNVDYVTTTGQCTGVPAPIDKLTAMHEVLGTAKLAVASGVSADNVSSYVPLVDAILIPSSLESRFGEIDSERLRIFMAAFRHSINLEREKREELTLAVEPELTQDLHLDFSFNAGW